MRKLFDRNDIPDEKGVIEMLIPLAGSAIVIGYLALMYNLVRLSSRAEVPRNGVSARS
jgi:hypothetical protein